MGSRPDGHQARGSLLVWFATIAGIVALGLFEFAPLWPAPPTDDDAFAFLMLGRALTSGEYGTAEGISFLTGVFRGFTKIGITVQSWALYTLAGERHGLYFVWCFAWHILHAITCYVFARRALGLPRDSSRNLLALVLCSMTALGVLLSPTFISYSIASIAVLACGIVTRWGMTSKRVTTASLTVAAITILGLLHSELAVLGIAAAAFVWWSAPRASNPAGVARFVVYITPTALPAGVFVGWSFLLLAMGNVQGGASPLSRLASTVAADTRLLSNLGLSLARVDDVARWLFLAPDTSFGHLPHWSSILVCATVVAGAARTFARDASWRPAVIWGILHAGMFFTFLISRHLHGYTEYRHAYVSWFGVALLWLAAAQGLAPFRRAAAAGTIVAAALIAFNAAAARHDARILRSYGDFLARSARGVAEEIREAPAGSRIWAFCCTRSESFINGVGPDAEALAALIAQLPAPPDRVITLINIVRPAHADNVSESISFDEKSDRCLAHRSDGLFGRVLCADVLTFFEGCGLNNTCPSFGHQGPTQSLRLMMEGIDLTVDAEVMSPVTFRSVMGLPPPPAARR